MNGIRLRTLSVPLRLAVTCLILILAGGMIASALHLRDHYRNKDENPELSMDDIVGSFHGMDKPARLAVAIETVMRDMIPTEEEYDALRQWLASDRISEDYDSLELGDYAPAEIIAMNCLGCHTPGAENGGDIGERVPLVYWDDVKQVAFAKKLEPVPLSILTTSFHTHALTMPLVGLAASLLFLAAGGSRLFRHGVIALAFLALLLDLGSWWLARTWQPFCWGIVVGGGLFGALTGLQLLVAFGATWFGRRG